MQDNSMFSDETPLESASAGVDEIAQHTKLSVLDSRVSIYDKVTQNSSQESAPLRSVLRGIQSGRWGDAVARARTKYQTNGKGEVYDALKKALPAFTPGGIFPRRNKDGITDPSGLLPGDIDGLNQNRLSQGLADLKCDPHVGYCFISPSGYGIKLGVRIPPTTDDAVFKEHFAALEHYLRKKYGLILDPSGKDISRLCFVSHDPECYVNPDAAVFMERRTASKPEPAPTAPPHVAQPVDMDDAAIITKASSAKNGAKFSSLWNGDFSEYAHGDNDGESEGDLALCTHLAFWTGKDADRIDRLFRQSGLMRDKWDRDDYRERTITAAIAVTTETYSQGRNGTAEAPGMEDAPNIPLSDVYNAARLVKAYGDVIRHCGEWKKILVYRNGVWRIDHDGGAVECAKATAAEMHEEARKQKAAADLKAARFGPLEIPKEVSAKCDAAEAYLKHAVKAHSAAAIHNMIELAKSIHPLPVSHEVLGTHHDLLSTLNCVIDLKTGAVLPHSPDYLFTGCVPVVFDPHAVCPRWEQFLLEIMGYTIGKDSPEDSGAVLAEREKTDERARVLVSYLKRVFGYCLTGLTKEQALFFFYGGGANGKSVLFEILLKLFGADFGKKGTSNFLMVRKHDAHPTEQADLYRKRLVVVPETEKGARLSEVLVRELTGSDQITARHMNEDFWSFWPTHKFIIGTNHLPTFRDMSYAMRRRLQMVPTSVTFYDPDKPDDVPPHVRDNPHTAWADKDLPATLLNELPGILAWCVQGAVEWRASGIKPPAEVLAATKGYFESQDVVQRFIDDCCYTGKGKESDITRLWESFKKWADDGNEQGKFNRTMFKEAMEAKGYTQERKKERRYWAGVGLLGSAYEPTGDKTHDPVTKR